MGRTLPEISSTTTGAATVTALAGCTDFKDDNGTENDSRDPEMEISYSISDPKSHDEIPEKVVEHPSPKDFQWIVVDLELISGTLDAGDILGLTQVSIDGTTEFTRTVEIHTPDEVFLFSSDNRYTMNFGGLATAYYRVSGD